MSLAWRFRKYIRIMIIWDIKTLQQNRRVKNSEWDSRMINTPIVVTSSWWTMQKVINSGYGHTYQCPPKSYTAGLRQVSEATITAQSVQPQGEIPEEGRKKTSGLNFKTQNLVGKIIMANWGAKNIC